jgi:hypothetical protein
MFEKSVADHVVSQRGTPCEGAVFGVTARITTVYAGRAIHLRAPMRLRRPCGDQPVRQNARDWRSVSAMRRSGSEFAPISRICFVRPISCVVPEARRPK